MKKNILFLGKGILLTGIILTLLFGMNQILLPKFFYNQTWSGSATATGFYEMPENSVDVITLGSSHMATGFIPQELYDSYGITAYNLSSDQQNLLISYYWLKEALEYQSPKVVVLDVYLLHSYNKKEPLNSSEASQRRTLDYMQWGKVKAKAVRDIVSLDSKQDFWSYFFTNIRYHTRWQELNCEDFSLAELESHYELKGFVPLYHLISDQVQYAPFQKDSTRQESILPTMEKYLDRIVELCRENNIELILIKTPASNYDSAKDRAVEKYAQEHGVTFLDFNLEENYQALNFDFLQDMADGDHANVRGAVKITKYLGNLLQEKYGLGGGANGAWEETEEYFRLVYNRFALGNETDLAQYLRLVSRGQYTLFIAARDDASTGLNNSALSAMRSLGLKGSLAGKYRNSYLAVWDQGECREETDAELITMAGNFGAEDALEYKITSAGYGKGNTASIIIDGEEYSLDERGLNMVVYDHFFDQVIDAVCFDTADVQGTAIR